MCQSVFQIKPDKIPRRLAQKEHPFLIPSETSTPKTRARSPLRHCWVRQDWPDMWFCIHDETDLKRKLLRLGSYYSPCRMLVEQGSLYRICIALQSVKCTLVRKFLGVEWKWREISCFRVFLTFLQDLREKDTLS